MAYISFQPSDFFNTKLYVGTGATANAVTGVGFQPDSTWIKDRDDTYSHRWWNSVTGATKYTTPDNTDVMGTNAQGLQSFDADGFTVGSMASVGENADNFVSWNWKAGTTSGLSGGTITPTAYSFNATSGVSIVQYDGNSTSGATVPHGLGATPEFVIIKCLDAAENWAVGHNSLGWTKYLRLDTAATATTTSVIFNDTAPTSTLVTLGDNSMVNTQTTDGYIMYAFAPVKGFSKFGRYTGNQDNDGPFIYTGFRPKMMIIKGATTGENWMIFGYAPPYNLIDKYLQPDTNVADMTNVPPGDFLSNGYKIRDDDNKINQNNTYVYAAFAEFPFVSSNDIPGVAR